MNKQERREKNARTREQHRIWQNEWREVMGKPVDVEVEPRCDFDLHFDIWNLDKKKFLELFSSFPKGIEIGNKAYDLRNGLIEEFNVALNKEEIIAETQKVIEAIQKVAYSKELNNSEIVYRRGKEIMDTDVNFSEMIIDVIPMNDIINKEFGEDGCNAYYFLSEPMYRMQSSYIPSYWVLWSLANKEDINPFNSLLKLHNNNCRVFCIPDGGVFVFQTD